MPPFYALLYSEKTPCCYSQMTVQLGANLLSNDELILELEECVCLISQTLASQEIPETAQSYAAKALMLTIMENVSSCVVLLKNEHYTAVPIILRSVLDASVSLINLLSDKRYIDTLMASEARQKIKLYEGLQRYQPANFTSQDYRTLEKLLLKSKQRLKSTNSRYHQYINTAAACRLLEEDECGTLYTIYCFLSEHVHNGLGAIGSMYLKEKEIAGSYVPSEEDAKSLIDYCGITLTMAAAHYFKFIGLIRESEDVIRYYLREEQSILEDRRHSTNSH